MRTNRLGWFLFCLFVSLCLVLCFLLIFAQDTVASASSSFDWQMEISSKKIRPGESVIFSLKVEGESDMPISLLIVSEDGLDFSCDFSGDPISSLKEEGFGFGVVYSDLSGQEELSCSFTPDPKITDEGDLHFAYGIGKGDHLLAVRRESVTFTSENTPPKFETQNLPEAVAGRLYFSMIEVSDSEGDKVSIYPAEVISGGNYCLSPFPSWLELEDLGNGTAIITGKPLCPGVFSVEIMASDGFSQTRKMYYLEVRERVWLPVICRSVTEPIPSVTPPPIPTPTPTSMPVFH